MTKQRKHDSLNSTLRNLAANASWHDKWPEGSRGWFQVLLYTSRLSFEVFNQEN